MVKRRLSQTLGQIKKGYAVDTFQGGFPVRQVFKNPAAASATAVHANMALSLVAQEVTTGITNPDFYRCLKAVGDNANVSGTLTVRGTDWAGLTVEEDFVLNGTATVSGTRPFKTVNKIDLPAQGDDGNGHNVSLGYTDRFGLYRPLASGINSLELLKVDGTIEDAADTDEVEADFATFIPTTAPNGSKTIEVDFLADIF